MEFIHPPIDFTRGKSRKKSPYVGRRSTQAASLESDLDHPVLPPTGFTSMFSVDTSFQAGCGLNSSYNAFFKITLKSAINL